MSASKQLSESQHNGLAQWRQRQAEARQLRLLELAHYREFATTEVRDGRTFTVVRIPDRYDAPRPDEPTPVQIRRSRKRT